MYSTLTVDEICWLAGFLEGEGCFFTSPTGSPAVKTLSTDFDVLARYSELVKRPVRGPYKDNRGHKDRWEVNLYGEDAVELMLLLLPHMGLRRSNKIRGILEAAKTRKLKKLVRDARPRVKFQMALCHVNRPRYHSSGQCHSCYSTERKRRKRDGLFAYPQSLSLGSSGNTRV